MKHADIRAMMAEVAPVVKEFTAAALSPFAARLDALEKQIGALPAPMTRDDATLVILAEIKSVSDALPDMVAAEVEKAVAAIPPAKDGEDGKPGKDADEGMVASRVRESISDELAALRSMVEAIPEPPSQADIDSSVRAAVATIPPPKDGADGKSLTVEDVRPLLDEIVSTAFSALPVPQDGVDGKDADVEEIAARLIPEIERTIAALPIPKDGRDGIDGKDGADGLNGKDGLDGVEFLRGADGHLIVTMSNGTTRDLGEVNGKDGEAVPASEISDGEFQRRVEAATSHEAISQRAMAIRQSNGEARNLQIMREAIVGAMKETKPPAIHVSVPITMPKRGREVMTVEHDANGRIKRSIKEEVD